MVFLNKFHVKTWVKVLIGIVSLFLYCEYLVYFIVLWECDWPKLEGLPEKFEHEAPPVKVMFLADTHLLGSRKGHWLDKLRREWQMHRAFQTAMILHRPELVFVLGDLTDEGLFCGPAEFNYYVHRFYDLFKVPEDTQMYVAVGNHDIGFHYSISPYVNQRFVAAFKSPAIQRITVRGVHFILVNSMALEGDGCFLCKPAEQQLAQIERTLKCSKGSYNGKCDPLQKLNYSRPILLQHYPLYRASDMECKDFDAAPLPIKKEIFREKWECLSKEATDQLMRQIEPRLSLSGHTHHGCTRPLPGGIGLEITIPSFSWRNKENPNYGLGVFTPDNYAFSKCEMPKENTVISLYFFGFSVVFFWLLCAFFTQPRRFTFMLK